VPAVNLPSLGPPSVPRRLRQQMAPLAQTLERAAHSRVYLDKQGILHTDRLLHRKRPTNLFRITMTLVTLTPILSARVFPVSVIPATLTELQFRPWINPWPLSFYLPVEGKGLRPLPKPPRTVRPVRSAVHTFYLTSTAAHAGLLPDCQRSR
jgi:hypothetical protein